MRLWSDESYLPLSCCIKDFQLADRLGNNFFKHYFSLLIGSEYAICSFNVVFNTESLLYVRVWMFLKDCPEFSAIIRYCVCVCVQWRPVVLHLPDAWCI